jgi:hypothetical protein
VTVGTFPKSARRIFEPSTMAATTPSTADALNDTDGAPCKERRGARHVTVHEDESTWKAVAVLVSIGVLILATACASHKKVTIRAPSSSVWLELGGAIGLSVALNVLLAACCWHWSSRKPALLALGGLLLVIPYTLPLRGIAATAMALILFIGVWKLLDVLAGTSPPALRSAGFPSFVAHFASPVEYRLDARLAVAARRGLWRAELWELTQICASLSLVLSVHGALSAHTVASTAAAALTLYAEVWMVYLFLRVLTSAFSTLLALCGFAPRTMWRAPLLTSTSVSDFWGRRWNLLIHGLFRRTVFSPLTLRGVPAWAAGALAFAISGLFHEYAFALQQPSLRDSLGRCLLFFLAQAPAVSAEKALRRRLGVPQLLQHSATACTIGCTLLIVPFAPLFMHPLKTSDVFASIFDLVPRVAFE